MNEKLFIGDPDPSHSNYLRFSESQYDFYRLTSRPAIQRAKEFMEKLFSCYPDGKRKLALAKSVQKSKESFASEFFELLVHKLFLEIGCKILSVEPEISHEKRTSKPELLISIPDGREFYVEATVVRMEAEMSRGPARIVASVVEHLNSNVRCGKYSYGLSVLVEGVVQPTATYVARKLREFDAQLDYETVRSNLEGGISRALKLVVTSNGWTFEFTPIPLDKEAFDTHDRIVGMEDMEEYIGVPAITIGDAIRKKVKQHKHRDRGLIICAACSHWAADFSDLIDAALGSESIQVPMNRKMGMIGQAKLVRSRDGIWLGKSGPRNPDVTNVLAFEHVGPCSFHIGRITSIENPFLDETHRVVLPDLPRTFVDTNNKINTHSARLGEFFGIDSSWLS